MRDCIGDDAVQDVWIDQTFGGLLAHAIVAIAPAGPGRGKRVGRTVADIAPFIIDDVNVPLHMDPSVRDARGNATPSSKIIIDATQKFDPGPLSLPPRDLMMKALDAWKDCQLPDFQIPKRARLRIEKS
jgi:hypothetical protein